VNPFEFLGVEPDATEQEIKSAYRQRLKQLHPDKHVGAPEHIVTQLAEFTRQLNDVYVDLNQNLDYYRHKFAPTEPRIANKPNPFGLTKSTLSRLESLNISSPGLDRLQMQLRFPHVTSNLALTAIRMRSLALKDGEFREEFSFQLAMMFLLGARVAQSVFGERFGESGEVLDLEYPDSQSYLQGATDDAQYFLDVSDSDIQSFVTTFPSILRKWIKDETDNASIGNITTGKMLQRFFVSGFVFVSLQA
jgi:hypothetical protein